MPAAEIIIKGAREHNLRGVDLRLPRNQLICLTGVSGSGKSSLAFDTVYAEGQRRYVESLSSFARQFLGQMPKPEVEAISGLSPTISISQKSSGQNPRSTVGTITEIYDYLRVLFARVGQGHCPQCSRPITAQSREQIIERILQFPAESRLLILAPVVRRQKGEHRDLFIDLQKQGFNRARVDGKLVPLNDAISLDRQMRHDIEVVIDRITIGPQVRGRLAEDVELALKLGSGSLILAPDEATAGGGQITRPEYTDEEEEFSAEREAETGLGEKDSPRKAKKKSKSVVKGGQPGDVVLSCDYACTHCGISFDPPTPQLFSFNSPQGMCPQCDGLGEVFTFDPRLLVPDDSLSLKDGAIELVGKWKEMGRWRRHIYQGVADTLERIHNWDEGTLLESPWRDLDKVMRGIWLAGTGDTHITFTWRGGNAPQKYGGHWEGFVAQFLERYRGTESKPHRAALEKYMTVTPCLACGGTRLKPQSRAVRLTTTNPRFPGSPSLSLPEVCSLPVQDAAEFFQELELDATGQLIATELQKEILGRLGFLVNVGLEYLTLDRTAPTLSGGESQRIRLAGQIGCGLVGVLYILDEPSIGLHPRDNDKLINTLKSLRDKGNTVLVVEHDEDTMRAADQIVDFGPGPGVRGGEVVAQGNLEKLAKSSKSLTGKFLSGQDGIAIPDARRTPTGNVLRIEGARHNNLRGVDVEIPLGCFVCVTGVSGSGKSSLVNDILVEALRRDLNGGEGTPGGFDRITGLQHLDKLIAIDQSPIGRTPRSNPATYIKVFDDIRDLYVKLPEAKARGYKAGRFSFNVSGGRCEACEGNGSQRQDMDFLADIWVTCTVCEGRRFNRETLQIKFKGKSISEVLEMDVQEALRHFENVPDVRHKLQTLHDVGLDYLKLGQPSPTLSGGEAQRIKLARELVKKSTGRTLYLLDEPTTGLHFADIKLLLKVLHNFAAVGNTVLVVEHNLDVIKTADWLIDMGPEGGRGGGRVIAAGTPEAIAAGTAYLPQTQDEKVAVDTPNGEVGESLFSYTGVALAKVLGVRHLRADGSYYKAPPATTLAGAAPVKVAESKAIIVRGARQHNLKGVDVTIPRDQMTVCCGLSGSGKSSLAMDTIYAEGQRRYVESLSSYARQFVGQMQKPRLEHIEGLSPAIAIEQKHLGHTPRSTVGTVTEIYDYLRILFARLGQPYCPGCNLPIGTQTSDQIIDQILRDLPGERILILAPQLIDVGENYGALWEELRGFGYQRVRVDGKTHPLDDPPAIDRRRKHSVQVVIDRANVRADARSRLADSVEKGLDLGMGEIHIAVVNEDQPEPKWRVETFSQHLACHACGRSFERLGPHHFSFNSALGWCGTCEGLGVQIGANPAALLRDSKLTLRQGAVLVWPDVARPYFGGMLAALARQTGLPLDTPFDSFNSRQRRQVMYGTGDEWLAVTAADVAQYGPSPETAAAPTKKRGKATKELAARALTAETTSKTKTTDSAAGNHVLFRFQYKGLYPALEESARLSVTLRTRLDHLVTEVECGSCGGSRLREDAAAMQFQGRTIHDLCALPLGQLTQVLQSWNLTGEEKKIAGELLREIRNRTQFLVDVGLEYLSLARPAPTLSGGEAQRIRLASQVGSGLCGVLYVLDEPTIGLHPRDNTRLIKALQKLRDLGNTLLVVEHDKEVVSAADQLLDFGPGAGEFGGNIVARGTPTQVAKTADSVTGPFLSGKKNIPIPANRRSADPAQLSLSTEITVSRKLSKAGGNPRNEVDDAKQAVKKNSRLVNPFSRTPPTQFGYLEIVGARHNNLRNVTVRIPLGTLTAVTGVSGSGKSSLLEDVLYNALAKTLHRAATIPGAYDAIRGIDHINKVIRVDQQALGNTPTSNPATYTGVFELIRQLFSQLPDAKVRGYTARRFSFNAPGGRCEACEGNGQKKIEMHFLPDVWVTCETCQGKRYNPETLGVKFHGHSIADVLELSCGRALALFSNIPKIRRILQTLCDVGLDYLRLGQAAPTLSGGEAQRVKLAAELARPDTGRTLYLLDEPTTGLHFEDIHKLLEVLQRLVDLGNSVVVIEHNLDVIKCADWLIEMGPEAGDGGGQVIYAGTPEGLVAAAGGTPGGKPTKAKKSKSVETKPVISKGPGESASAAADESRYPLASASHTALALAPVLAAGPYVTREKYDPAAVEKPRQGDLDIDDVGRNVHMPWEADGERWHTQERVGRNGEPCRWDGRILAEVVRRIEAAGEFTTNWNERTVVEITGEKKSDGWFFHALTGEQWVLKLKFRCARSTFQREELQARLKLRPFNELPELPVYGNEPRVKCVNLGGPWQEVQLQLHAWEEINIPEFWQFVEEAVAGFVKFTNKAAINPADVMPWKVLGQKWHLARKGFPPGKKIAWETETLVELCDILQQAAPGAQFLWNNQQIVNVMLPGKRDPWAQIYSKKTSAIELVLRGPKNKFAYGQVVTLGREPELDTLRGESDIIKLKLIESADLNKGDLAKFLSDHAAATGENG
ncbi:MAG: excinuclease ABC subunit UvrA [Pirellulales bacterium]|nr:excinuclease ABC subunit UvrA [Pirellulales bacterium]